jgi:hypothetical protein
LAQNVWELANLQLSLSGLKAKNLLSHSVSIWL